MSRDLLLSLKPTLASVVRSTQYWPKDRLKNTSSIYREIFSLKKPESLCIYNEGPEKASS